MTSKEIQNKIDKLASKPGSAMPESIRLQVEATREHTLALYEGALQTAKVGEEISRLNSFLASELGPTGVSLVGRVSAALGAIVSELKVFNKTLGEFGVGVVQVPPSGPTDEYPYMGGAAKEPEEQTS